MKKKLLISLLLLSSGIAFSQDAHFSQYYNSRTWTNPAYVGCDSTLNLSLGYRNQWPKVNAYQSYFFSADKYFKWLKGGLGVNFLHDEEMDGALITSRVDLIYSGHIELCKRKMVLQPAVEFSYFQRHLDFSKLTFGDMIDERRGFVYTSGEIPGQGTKSNIDLSAGLLLYTNHFYGGIAAHHITEPDEGLIYPSKLPFKLTIHAGAQLYFKNDATKHILLSPNILYMKQSDFYVLMPGLTLKAKWLSIGFNYRNEDAMIGTLAFQNRFLRIGYSYDYTVSKLRNESTGGSHEIGITWFMNSKKSICTQNTLRLI